VSERNGRSIVLMLGNPNFAALCPKRTGAIRLPVNQEALREYFLEAEVAKRLDFSPEN
jgi:hypothetical protein